MILAPDRRIIAPSRRIAPFWRDPLARRPVRRHRPHCPLYSMADGDLQLVDAGGDIHLDASGNRYLACCCSGSPTTYIQARLCSSGALVDVWIKQSDLGSLPNYFKYAGNCYSVTSGDPTSTDPTGKTIAVGATLEYSCTSRLNSCMWTQARLCADGSAVDKWFAPGTTLPINFKISGVDYYVTDACTKSLSPGTPVGAYTASTGCPGGCCSSTPAIVPPQAITLTISGFSRCTNPCSCPADTCAGVDPGNGTFSLSLYYSDGTQCFYTDDIDAVNGVVTRSYRQAGLQKISGSIYAGAQFTTTNGAGFNCNGGHSGAGSADFLGSVSVPSGSCGGSVTGPAYATYDTTFYNNSTCASPANLFWTPGLTQMTVSW